MLVKENSDSLPSWVFLRIDNNIWKTPVTLTLLSELIFVILINIMKHHEEHKELLELLVPLHFEFLYACFWASLVAQMGKNPPAMRETWVKSLGWEDPLEEGMATYYSILAWRIPMDRGAWWATVHAVAESDTTEQLSTALYTLPLN